MTGGLRGKTAIVGTGHAGFGEARGLTAYDIMAQAGLAAVADAAGLTAEEALADEWARGRDQVAKHGVEGAARFASGKGRGGDFSDI